jgi:predicted acetyltransferase
MTSQFEYGSVSSLQEMQRLGEIIRQCFGGSPDDWERYLNRIGAENFRVLRQGEKAIAGLAIYHMGQWYGSKIVSMAGIAAVGVPPEDRGKGAAYELLSYAIQELYNLGVPISALYPATQALYRKVGYEQGGSFCRWELSTASIQLQERHLPIYTVSPVNYTIFEDIYNQQAQVNNGNLVRHRAIWERVLEPPKEEAIYAYLIGSESEPEGYIIFTQNREKQESAIEVRDWAILTASAAKRLWTFLADHRSQIDKISWRGSQFNPFMLLLPEQTAKIIDRMTWMLRIIDVPLALSKRGYPMGLEAELHLEVRDDLLAANNGKFCLRVSEGRSEVSQGGNGTLQLDIRGLASLYTGFLTPQQLQLLGYLNATQEDLETARLIFSGSHPWMGDFF